MQWSDERSDTNGFKAFTEPQEVHGDPVAENHEGGGVSQIHQDLKPETADFTGAHFQRFPVDCLRRCVALSRWLRSLQYRPGVVSFGLFDPCEAGTGGVQTKHV